MIPALGAAVAIGLGTWLGFPVASPIVGGFVLGLAQPVRAARWGAVAGLLAWGGPLALAAIRGDGIAAVSAKLGAVMGLPGWAPLAATLLLPAILAAAAAWLGHLASPRAPTTANANS